MRILDCGLNFLTVAILAKSSFSFVPTLIFTVVQPGNPARTSAISLWLLSAGIVAFTPTELRKSVGGACVAASIAQANQREDSSSEYSRKGENSAQPCGPSKKATSR